MGTATSLPAGYNSEGDAKGLARCEHTHQVSQTSVVTVLGSASPRVPCDWPFAMALTASKSAICSYPSHGLTKVVFLQYDHQAEVIATG